MTRSIISRHTLESWGRTLALAGALGVGMAAASCAVDPGYGAGGGGPTMGTGMTIVTVEAGYRERIMLPPGHVLTVKIEDVSLADAPARVMAEASEPLNGRAPPYTVTLGFPTSQIDPRHTYAARASISDENGRLVFTTVERHVVLTQGARASAQITMQGVR